MKPVRFLLLVLVLVLLPLLSSFGYEGAAPPNWGPQGGNTSKTPSAPNVGKSTSASDRADERPTRRERTTPQTDKDEDSDTSSRTRIRKKGSKSGKDPDGKPSGKPKPKKPAPPRPAKKPSKTKIEGFEAAGAEGGFGTQVVAEIASFFFNPMDLFVQPDTDFEVRVQVHNATSRAPDGFRFTVAYSNPWLDFLNYDIEPLNMAQSLSGNASAAVTANTAAESITFTQKPGRLTFSARLDAPITIERFDLVTLRFHAKDVVGRTTLRFLVPPEETVALFAEGENILGRPAQNFPGVLNANLFVMPSMRDVTEATTASETAEIDLATAMPHEMPQREETRKGWLSSRPTSKPDATVALALQGPPNSAVVEGEDFWVDLVLLNDSQVLLDSIGVRLAFDPKALSVIDEDKGNWISRGVNVWDGAFHDLYPFDFHRENQVDNARGTITYALSRHTGQWPFPTGIFARVHFRAERATAAAMIRITRDTREGRPRTYVKDTGTDRLEKSWRTNGPPSVVVQIERGAGGEALVMDSAGR